MIFRCEKEGLRSHLICIDAYCHFVLCFSFLICTYSFILHVLFIHFYSYECALTFIFEDDILVYTNREGTGQGQFFFLFIPNED